MSHAPDKTTDDCLSDLRLDHLVADEVAEDERAAIDAHLASCERCTARVAELRADRASFENSHLADGDELPAFLKEGAQVVSLAERRRSRLTTASGALATLAAAGLILFIATRDDRDALPDPGTRTKGRSFLSFFVNDAGGARQGATGEIVHPRDQLRFVFELDTAGHIAVISRDGVGTVGAYASNGPRMLKAPAGKTALPTATALDQVLGTERIAGFRCAIDVGVPKLIGVVHAAGRDRPIKAPDHCEVDVVVVEKRAR